MPHYYIDLRNDGGMARDEEGAELVGGAHRIRSSGRPRPVEEGRRIAVEGFVASGRSAVVRAARADHRAGERGGGRRGVRGDDQSIARR